MAAVENIAHTVIITNNSCEILYVKLIKYIVQGLIIGSIITSKFGKCIHYSSFLTGVLGFVL